MPFPIFHTAADQQADSRVRPPANGEVLSSKGMYAVGQRHAYLMGTNETLCGLSLLNVYMLAGMKWHESGSNPPACGVCSSHAG